MRTGTLLRQQLLPRALDELFPFFAEARNLEHLTPPWLRFSVLTPEPIAMCAGATIDYRLRWRGLPIRWRSEIAVWDPPHRFVDRQVHGPYRLWHHEHSFEARPEGTMVTDRVDYAAPFGRLSHRLIVDRDVARIFDYRQQALEALFSA
jgi:ligand-binding SRPBCC domain-containing protein